MFFTLPRTRSCRMVSIQIKRKLKRKKRKNRRKSIWNLYTSVSLSICISIRLRVCLCVCVRHCLCLFICLSVCLSAPPKSQLSINLISFRVKCNCKAVPKKKNKEKPETPFFPVTCYDVMTSPGHRSTGDCLNLLPWVSSVETNYWLSIQ